MFTESLAAWESRLRPFLTRVSPELAVRLYSQGRTRFLSSFAKQPPRRAFAPEGLERTLWGLEFRSPLLNAAGMFKNGQGYDLCFRQGAGAYLAGTTTEKPRRGNHKRGVSQPFAPYPGSRAASNWLGLPNDGHRRVAKRLARVRRQPGCPLGVSAAADPAPGVDEEAKLEQLVAALVTYEAAGVDFLEINESCPNTAEDPAGFDDLNRRLAYVKEHYVDQRRRFVPVIVKMSCDTMYDDVAALVDTLGDLGFDGVNFGNTSTDYFRHRRYVKASELDLYDYFTMTFGGGLSGRPLARDSLMLVTTAAERLQEKPPEHEFHIVRTGGVEGAKDVRKSLEAGASLCQWYTGYFEAFGRHGHGVYRRLYEDLAG